MIVDYDCKCVNNYSKQHVVRAAHINKDGLVEVKQFQPKFDNWEVCSDDDNERDKDFKALLGESVKRVPSHKFEGDNLREWLLYRNPDTKHVEEFLDFHMPACHSVDIEIDMTDCKEFPNPAEAKYPIESISMTAPKLSTLVMSKSKRWEPWMDEWLEDKINDHLNQYEIPRKLIKEHAGGRLKYRTLIYNNETELITGYLNAQRKFLHTIIGWNWNYFDAEFIKNRCNKLGIDRSIASPVNEMSSYGDKPRFRLEFDYMTIVEKYAWQYIGLSKRLDEVAEKALGVGKVHYDGTFADLYNGPYEWFLFYSAIDTILVEMIHMVSNAIFTPAMLAYYARVPIGKINGVTTVAGAMYFDELYASNIVHCNRHKITKTEQYEGGFVMDPRVKTADWIVVSDFAGMYAKAMQNLNCSVEAILGVAKNEEEFQAAIKAGHVVSMRGTIYKNDGPNMVKRVITRLLDERYTYKKLSLDVAIRFKNPIENELARRGIHVK